jgi:glycosyltransferase involved in cell wall biosynthesis
MDILYITNIPSPYVVKFLNELGKKANVLAVFERLESSERDKSWRVFQADHFKYKILKGIKYSVDKAICPSVIDILKKNRDRRIIISNPITATGILAISWLKRNHIAYALQVEGGIHKNGKGLVEAIKRFCFSGASHYYSSGKTTDEYLRFYGADSSRISYYPFTSISEKDVLECVKTREEKRKLRKELGIEGEFIVISVGQFIHRKGFDVLLKALGTCEKNIAAYIIGGNPTEEYISLCKKWGLTNVHFVDFQSKEIILKWMQASDIMVMPTRYDVWGLVVNEAMAQGLPVISSDACVAGLEMIVPRANGFIFHSEDHEQLSYYIGKCAKNDNELSKMSIHALKTATEYTYEKMADAHLLDW